MKMKTVKGTLKKGEFHPATKDATQIIAAAKTDPETWQLVRTKLEQDIERGDRFSEICLETVNRLDAGQPVGERYMFGLACWLLLYRD